MDRQRPPAGAKPTRPTMPDGPGQAPDQPRPTVYEIRLRGHLDDRWADPREGLSVSREESGDTVLTVPVADQAALHGLLKRLRDVGVPLVSINPAVPGRTGNSTRERNR